MIDIISANIEEVKIIKPKIHVDKRGYFFESFNQDNFYSKIDKIDFIQDNESKSSFGVLRGMHYQKFPYEQSKLIRVIKGKIQDVALDLRRESFTYGQYASVLLSDKNHKQLFIPKGFAHGFLVLSKEAIISYKVDSPYNKKFEDGIMYNSKNFNINWELEDSDIILSNKDKKW
tara:strand:+ start:127 stop:648 length:522 start_codon:yes stop_codon:yes gene_type:complete